MIYVYETLRESDDSYWIQRLVVLSCFPFCRFFGMDPGIAILKTHSSDMMTFYLMTHIKLFNSFYSSAILTQNLHILGTAFLMSTDLLELVYVMYSLSKVQSPQPSSFDPVHVQENTKSSTLNHPHDDPEHLILLAKLEYFAFSEYVEIALPVIFGFWTTVVRHLPVHQYIPILAKLNDSVYEAQMANLGLYIFLELVSLLALVFFAWQKFKVKLHHVLLTALVVHRKCCCYCTTLLIVLGLATQLQQVGYDFSLQFDWL